MAASVNVAPLPKLRFTDNNGNPAANYKLFTYAAGTTTKQNTYTDSTGATPNTNPVILDARGEAPVWPDNTLAYKYVLAPPTDTDPPTNPVWTIDNVPVSALSQISTQNDSTKGAGLVGLHLTGTGEVDTTVGPFLNLLVKGLKRNFGCALDGTTDDYAKALKALTYNGKIIEHEGGTCLLNTGAIVPTCTQIVGQNDLISIFKLGAGITKGLSIGGVNSPRKLKDFKVDGSLTTNAIGIYLGDTAGSWGDGRVENVRCSSFSGASGVGMRVGDVLKSYINAYLELSTINLLIQKTTGGFPTTIHFDSGVCTGAGTYGAKIIDANGLLFTEWDFESSGLEGLIADSSSGSTIVDLVMFMCWFEANYGNTNTQFHARFGTNSGAGTIRPAIIDTFFSTNSGGTAAKAIIFNGSEVAGYKLSDPRLASGYAGAVRRQNGAYGRTLSWLPYLDYNTVFSEDTTQGLDFGPFAYLTDYTPTFSSEAGNYGASFSGSPTITKSSTQHEGRNLFGDWSVGLQLLGGVNPHWVAMTIPPGLTLRRDCPTTCQLSIGGTQQIGQVVAEQASNLIKIYKSDRSLFGAGNALTFGFQSRLEIV